MAGRAGDGDGGVAAGTGVGVIMAGGTPVGTVVGVEVVGTVVGVAVAFMGSWVEAFTVVAEVVDSMAAVEAAFMVADIVN